MAGASRLLVSAFIILVGLLLIPASSAIAWIHGSAAAACGVPDANGWTTFCATATTTGSCSAGTADGTCVVYASTSGNDTTCAPVLASSGSFTPCATLAKAKSLMRNGKPDWLLLKRGDTFTPDGSNANFGTWALSGASATAPMVIGSYDPSQPGVVDPYVSGSRPVIENFHGVTPISTTGSTGGDYLAIVGLDFYNYTEDPSNGSYNPSWSGPTGISLGANTLDWVLIEDCRVRFYGFNVDVEPTNNSNPNASTSAATFNRNEVLNAYATPGTINSSGMYIGTAAGNSVVANLYLTENIVDHNGWNATVSGANPQTHNHNIYVECVTSTVQPTNSLETVKYNIISNDSDAPQFRVPGTYTNNLLAFVPTGFKFGASTSQTAASCTGPQTVQTATYNVVVNSNSNNASSTGGAFGTVNMTSPTSLANNIISTYNASGTQGAALFIDSQSSSLVTNNNTVWDWGTLVSDSGSGDTTTPNNYNCTTCNSGGAYPDPYRSVGSYWATLSGATASAVVTGAINNGSASAGNILTVTGVTSGTLNVGDAITFPGQSNAVVITGNSTIGPNLCGGSTCTGTGGTGTYAVNIANGHCSSSLWSSCTTAGAVSLLVTSQTLTDYSANGANGFLAKAETSSKGNDLGNAYRACNVNDYIRADFGLAAQGCPTNG